MIEKLCVKLWYALLEGEITSITDLTTKDEEHRKYGDFYCLNKNGGGIMVNKSYAPRGAWIGISFQEFERNMLPHNDTENLKIEFRKRMSEKED